MNTKIWAQASPFKNEQFDGVRPQGWPAKLLWLGFLLMSRTLRFLLTSQGVAPQYAQSENYCWTINSVPGARDGNKNWDSVAMGPPTTRRQRRKYYITYEQGMLGSPHGCEKRGRQPSSSNLTLLHYLMSPRIKNSQSMDFFFESEVSLCLKRGMVSISQVKRDLPLFTQVKRDLPLFFNVSKDFCRVLNV